MIFYVAVLIAMKILHLTERVLPDWIIERAAITALKAGHEVLFGENKANNHNRIFPKVYLFYRN